jgi:hypothetical protein
MNFFKVLLSLFHKSSTLCSSYLVNVTELIIEFEKDHTNSATDNVHGFLY